MTRSTAKLEGVPSRYTVPPKEPEKPEINDSIPEHPAPPAETTDPQTGEITETRARGDDPGDIPAGLRRKSMRDKLIDQLAGLTTKERLPALGVGGEQHQGALRR